MNFVIYIINEGLSRALPFVTMLIVAKYIDVESFGLLTLYYITLEVFTLLITNNIRATTRIDYFKCNELLYVRKTSAHLVGTLFIGLCVFIIYFICRILYLDILAYNFISIVLLILTAILRSPFFFVLSDLQCRENAKKYGFYNIISVFTSNIFFIIAILNGYSVSSWFYCIFLGALMQTIFVGRYIVINSLVTLKFKLHDVFYEFKEGIVFMPQALGFWVGAAIDRILLSNFLGNIIVGQYMFVYQLSTPIIIFSTVVNLYLTPKINKLLKKSEFNNIVSTLNTFVALVVIAAIINFFLIQFIINEFYYDKYALALNSVSYVVLAVTFQAVYLIYMNVFYYIDMKKFVSFMILGVACIKILCAYLAVLNYGLQGLLFTNIFISASVFIITIIILKFKFNNRKENDKKIY